ncbi:hypothetical protein CYMTET_54086, partial [Cymbomonas tetramitiformis]
AAKPRKAEQKVLIPAEDFAAQHPGELSILVEVFIAEGGGPSTAPRQVELTMPSVESSVQEAKAALAAKVGIAANKQKLCTASGGFLRDGDTLAYYNISPGSTVQLSMKERGGRKKSGSAVDVVHAPVPESEAPSTGQREPAAEQVNAACEGGGAHGLQDASHSFSGDANASAQHKGNAERVLRSGNEGTAECQPEADGDVNIAKGADVPKSVPSDTDMLYSDAEMLEASANEGDET